MYISRTLESKVESAAKSFPVTLVCGPRQVGKTTLLKQLAAVHESRIQYVTLDNPMIRKLAKEDPELFLQQYETPVIIDEIQYAPGLFPYIKMRVDEKDTNGLYYLTGSQMFHMMQHVSESLAGRVGILNLFSLTKNEELGLKEIPFLPEGENLRERQGSTVRSINQVFEDIYRGGMPRLFNEPDLDTELFYASYIQTYLERDIREMVSIKDELTFLTFLSCAAARTGQELSYEELAREVGVDSKTIKSWISLLASSGLIYLLQPWHNNALKRIVKRPKLYFMDTGLCCYLARWNNPKALQVSAMAGALFETYVVTEILKTYSNNGKDIRNSMYFYRDNNKREIDLLIAQNGKLHPLEIKKSANPGRHALKNFTVLDSMECEIGDGGVICMSGQMIPMDQKNRIIPIDYI